MMSNLTKKPQHPPSRLTQKAKKPQVGSGSLAKILTPFKLLKPKIYKDQDIWGIDCNGSQNKHLQKNPKPTKPTKPTYNILEFVAH